VLEKVRGKGKGWIEGQAPIKEAKKYAFLAPRLKKVKVLSVLTVVLTVPILSR
jgi:hypothetical protein